MKRKKRRHLVEAGALALSSLASSAWGSTIYVDDSAPTSGQTGANWDHPYVTIQQALANAQGGDEIRVGQGSYYPANQSSSIELMNGVRIKGGYAGYGAGGPNDRGYTSTLSGDLGGGTHAYHVVHASSSVGPPTGTLYEDKANLDGFVISGGAATGTGTDQDVGGGIFIDQGHPTIRNCTIGSNSATGHGGGIYCKDTDPGPEIRNCAISSNSTSRSDSSGGGLGGNFSVTV